MTKIIPKDWVEPAKTGPLEIDANKETEMMAVAEAMVTEPIDAGKLAGKIEQHYVAKGEHYTSSQLKSVTDAVAKKLYVAPPVEETYEVAK